MLLFRLKKQTSTNIAGTTFKVLFFFIKIEEMMFLVLTMTIIGENTSTKCVQCIKLDNS